MKFKIGETEYDYRAALSKVSLGVLMELKSQGGPGRRGIALGMDMLFQALGQTDDAALVEDDEHVLSALGGLIFICKRVAGETVTWADACGYTWDDWVFVIEDSDLPDEEPDPQVPAGEASQPAGETLNEQPLNVSEPMLATSTI